MKTVVFGPPVRPAEYRLVVGADPTQVTRDINAALAEGFDFRGDATLTSTVVDGKLAVLFAQEMLRYEPPPMPEFSVDAPPGDADPSLLRKGPGGG